MSHHENARNSITGVFVKFAEVPEGVKVIASSDSGIRRLQENTFQDYNAGCSAMERRLGRRAQPPSFLVCELAN